MVQCIIANNTETISSEMTRLQMMPAVFVVVVSMVQEIAIVTIIQAAALFISKAVPNNLVNANTRGAWTCGGQVSNRALKFLNR